MRVEVASGVSLAVVARGTMIVKVWKHNVTSAKKAHHLHLTRALYVPSMPVTLISTKALFENEGIRTYFNDELWLALPDGDYVRFIETRTNYTIQFIDDAEPTPVSVHDAPKDFPAAHAITLREPLPVDWDLAHMRMVHFLLFRNPCSQVTLVVDFQLARSAAQHVSIVLV